LVADYLIVVIQCVDDSIEVLTWNTRVICTAIKYELFGTDLIHVVPACIRQLLVERYFGHEGAPVVRVVRQLHVFDGHALLSVCSSVFLTKEHHAFVQEVVGVEHAEFRLDIGVGLI
jgi:hypothetical protein